MKRFRDSAIGKSLVILAPLLLALTWAASASTEENHQENIKSKPINITVDPRFEIISIVFHLAGNSEYSMCRVPDYQTDIDKHFGAHKEHPAVKLARKLREDHGVSFDAPMSMAAYLEKGFGFRERKSLDDWPWGIDGRWTKEDAREFLEELRQFSKDTDFQRFFNDHKPLYDKAIANATNVVKDVNLLKWFDDFFGVTANAEINIVMAPANGPSNYGVRFESAGSKELYAIIGVWECDASGNPSFHQRQLATVVHEFCHSYVNPIVDANASKLEQSGRELFLKVEEKMRRNAYGDWLAMMRESVVRACELHFVGTAMDEGLKESYTEHQINIGFLWIRELSELVKGYEQQRDKYPTFESFFPKFIDAFEELSEKDFGDDSRFARSRPYTGTINAVFADRRSVIFVIPTHEGSKEAQDSIHAYVKEMHDRLLKESPILTDEEALRRDLSNNALAVYGTMKGNLWLAQKVKEFPVLIESDRIVADTVYPGAHLRFISAWPNPGNSKKGIVIYTAQQAEDIVGINSVFHGPTDYVVAEGTKSLKAANYEKKGGVWTLLRGR